jgi:hypothetical protein
MDATSLMLGIVFGSVGLGFFMYGKKVGLIVPIGVGIVLMVVPYFIPNVLLLVLVCGVLMALPFVFRDL